MTLIETIDRIKELRLTACKIASNQISEWDYDLERYKTELDFETEADALEKDMHEKLGWSVKE